MFLYFKKLLLRIIAIIYNILIIPIFLLPILIFGGNDSADKIIPKLSGKTIDWL